MNLRLLSILILLTSAVVANADDSRPNFLWIMSEDNSKHYLKMFDETGAATPNIEKLAAHGVMFERAFSNAPVCSVARTTLITGVYAPRLGTQFHRRIKPASMPDEWKMFPEYLRRIGYYTTNYSKKDYNAVESKKVWDESSKKAHWRNRQEGQPFFHVHTYTDSHESSLHFDQAWADNPDNKTDPASVTLAPYHPDTPLFRLTYARYHDRIKIIDDKVGRLVKQLTDDGELENTFVIYFGDHGGVLPRGKGFANESGLHVPLVVRVPDKFKDFVAMENGSKTKGFVEFVDFGPTMLKLAGLNVPEHMDGKPFLGEGVTAEEVASRNETMGYADRMDEKYDMVRTLRRGDWKYIRNYQAIYPDGLQNNYRYISLAWKQWRELSRGGKLNEAQNAFFKPKPVEQLFNISADPHEVNNLAGDPANAAKLEEMRSALTKRLKALPDLGFYPENFLVDQVLNNPIDFGQKNQAKIAELIDIADCAITFDKDPEALARALNSPDIHKQYWGWNACCILGEKAKGHVELAKKQIANGSDPIVRLRAVEFLGLIGEADPVPVIRDILHSSESPALNLIVLQTLVNFKDGGFGFDTTLDTSKIKVIDDQVIRRVGYLDGLTQKEIKQRTRELKQQKQLKQQKRKAKVK